METHNQENLDSMIALIQRVSEAAVHVNGKVIGDISKGILALIGVEKGDTEKQAERLLQRMLAYRIFPDQEDRMNLDVRQARGRILLVPQFTLAANTGKGNRASFTSAATPADGARLFDYLVAQAALQMEGVATGKFGADMKVHLVNDGPVTFWLQVPPAT
jgi:D-tyrosyl-tRNA(Tyr) deacylase